MYVFYTNADPLANRVTRFRAVDGKGVEPLLLFEAPITTGFPTHNGGNMAFGPDGMLYVTLGENNKAFWARKLDVPYGKVLRINPADGSVPLDNPFYDDEINLIRRGGDYGWWALYPCPGGFGEGLPSVQTFTPTMTPTGLVFY